MSRDVLTSLHIIIRTKGDDDDDTLTSTSKTRLKKRVKTWEKTLLAFRKPWKHVEHDGRGAGTVAHQRYTSRVSSKVMDMLVHPVQGDRCKSKHDLNFADQSVEELGGRSAYKPWSSSP